MADCHHLDGCLTEHIQVTLIQRIIDHHTNHLSPDHTMIRCTDMIHTWIGLDIADMPRELCLTIRISNVVVDTVIGLRMIHRRILAHGRASVVKLWTTIMVHCRPGPPRRKAASSLSPSIRPEMLIREKCCRAEPNCSRVCIGRRKILQDLSTLMWTSTSFKTQL